MEIKADGKIYKVKFGFNSFCDTDIMERTTSLFHIFKEEGVKDEEDVKALGKVRDLFVCVRELLFIGFQKYNPVESVQEVGEILDTYHDEAGDGEDRGILSLFTSIAEELLDKGFLGEVMGEAKKKNPEQEEK